MREFKSFFKTVGGNEGTLCKYPTRLDTYGCGCYHNCTYCYARSLLEFRNLWDAEEPSVADVDKVRRKVSRLEPWSVVRLGGMTDCFQPIEADVRATYKTIEALNGRGVHYLIVTKSALVANPEYMDLFDRELAHVQVSVTATDDAVAETYERASAVSARIRAVEKLYEGGFDVSLRLSPLIPEYVDFDRINGVECDKVLVEFLRSNGFIRRLFDTDYTQYTVRHGGYWHLPLERKLELLDNLEFREISVCDDVPEHYTYFKEHVNSNPRDCCNLRITR